MTQEVRQMANPATHLLGLAVAAHGGLDRFNQFKTVSAHLALGGLMWTLNHQEGVMRNEGVWVTVDLHREHVSYAPFKLPTWRTTFTPERVAIETTEHARFPVFEWPTSATA